MPNQSCPNCQQPGRLLESVSRYAVAEYYRCDDCEISWSYDKRKPHDQPKQITPANPTKKPTIA